MADAFETDEERALISVGGSFTRTEPTTHQTETLMRRALDKVLKDNVTMLASVVAWGVLSSVIPIVVGLLAISGAVLHDPVRQRIVIGSLSRALKSALSPGDLQVLVHTAVQHTGLLGILGAAGIL